jgi:hypothetical protein
MGSVKGEVFSRDPAKEARYVAASDRHFIFTLSVSEYDAIMARVRKLAGAEAAVIQPQSAELRRSRRRRRHEHGHEGGATGRSDEKAALLHRVLTRSHRESLRMRGPTIHREPRAS